MGRNLFFIYFCKGFFPYFFGLNLTFKNNFLEQIFFFFFSFFPFLLLYVSCFLFKIFLHFLVYIIYYRTLVFYLLLEPNFVWTRFPIFHVWESYPHNIVLEFHLLCLKILKHVEHEVVNLMPNFVMHFVFVIWDWISIIF